MPEFVIPPRVVREWDTEREDAMVARRLAGASLKQIAAELDVPVVRVDLVLRLRDLGPAQVRERRRYEADKARRALARRIGTLLRQRGPMDSDQVSALLGCPPAELLGAISPEDRSLLLRAGAGVPRVSEDQVLRHLRVAAARRAADLGRPGPVTLPMSWWDARRDPAQSLPGDRIAHRFHGWETACARAGIPVPASDQPVDRSRWDDDDLAWWLAVFLDRARTGRIRAEPTAVDYDDWARSDPRVPRAAALVARFGDWEQARTAAARQQLE